MNRFTRTDSPRIARPALMALAAVCGLALAGLTHASAKSPAKIAVDPPATTVPADAPRIEVVFVLDTTGSMSGLIEGAKQKIWSIANQMLTAEPRPEIRIGLVGYRDREDDYVTRRFPLTDDVDTIYGHLKQLQADGGGDTPESVNQALHEAVTQMGWSSGGNVYRTIFLVGDAPPHMDYRDDVKWPETVKRAAQAGIVVNTVQCGGMPATAKIWGEIAHSAEGVFVAIAQDGAMHAQRTPMDEELADLNRQLAGTVVPWGAVHEQAELSRKVKQAVEADQEAAVSRLSYVNKMGRSNTGRADLVDAVQSGQVELAKLEAEALPAQMKSLDPAAREAWLDERVAERAELNARIAKLVEARDAWIRTENARLAAQGEGDGFDGEVFDAIKLQSAEIGLAY